MKRHGSVVLVVTTGVLAELVQSSVLDLDAPLRSLVTTAALLGAGVLGWRRPQAERVDARTEAQ